MSAEPLSDGPGGVEGPGEQRRQVRSARPSLVSLLLEAGVADEEALRQAVEEAHARGLRLGELVLRRGWLDEEALARVLARQWGLRYLGRESLAIDPVAAGLLPYEQAVALGGCVIGIHDGGPLVVVADPSTERLNTLRARLQAIVVAAAPSFAIVTGSSLERLLSQLGRIRHGESASEQIPAAAVDATAGPAPPPIPAAEAAAGQADANGPAGDLQQATVVPTALRDQLARLNDDHDLALRQLAQLRQQLETARQLRTRDQEQIDELRARLHTQHHRYSELRRRLAELLAKDDRDEHDP